MIHPEIAAEPGERAPEGVAPDAAFARVPAALADAMRKRGFAALTSVQHAVLAAASEGRDLRISSQTGSGKTVAIGLVLATPLLRPDEPERRARPGPRVLVLVPTRELAMQVRDELRWLFDGAPGLGFEVVMGGTSLAVERRALARGPTVVVGTPGRTLDHLRTGALVAGGIEHLVLDEADRMLDMGFREELEAILEHVPEERRTHLVSATFPASVRRLADRSQRAALSVEGTRLGAANRDIEHVAHVIEPGDVYAAVVNLLLLNEGARCLIFVERRIDVTALAEKLAADGFPVQSFSGELPQSQRTRTLNAFRDGTMKTLVSTDVAARGIDVPDIELVIHVDPPESADAYVHRSGRTGRAGSAGRSVLLVTPRTRRSVVRMLEHARIAAQWVPAPSAAKVGKQLRERFRRQVRERLSAEAAPTPKQIEHATRLLDGRVPAEVVAQLLELARPAPARPPMEIGQAPEHPTRSPHASAPGHVRFQINWGERSGATASRVLGHVCRRGQIKSRLIGAIEIGSDESSFDVVASVAARFEKTVRRPDPRDPKLRISRAEPQADRSRPTKRSSSRTRTGPKRRG